MTSPITIDQFIALAGAAAVQCRIFIDVLRTFPRYAKDIDPLSQAPYRVPEFVHARRAIRDQEIEEVLALSKHLLRVLALEVPQWCEPQAPNRGDDEMTRFRSVRVIAVNDALFDQAVGFASAEGRSDDPHPEEGADPWSSCHIHVYELDGEKVEIRYERGIERANDVDITVSVEDPKRLGPGSKLLLSHSALPAGKSPLQIELERSEVSPRLYGVASLPIAWSDFLAGEGKLRVELVE
jgi:hypothetical protein